jgi:WD40 repeat protein
LWSLSGEPLRSLQTSQFMSSTAFSPDGKSFLVGGTTVATLWNYNGESKTFRHILDESMCDVISTAFSPDGKSILIGGCDGTAKLWSFDNNKQFLRTLEHKSRVNSVAFSPNGKSILTGSSDNTAKLWSFDGKLLQTFRHTNSVNSATFSSEGKSILTGSSDNTAKLWSLDGRLLQTFQHNDSVTSVSFSPNGMSFLTGSGNTAKLWDLDLENSLSALCEHLHDFASLSNDPNISEEDRNLRQRAKTACEGIPPPKTSFNFLKNGNLTLLSSIFIGKRD